MRFIRRSSQVPNLMHTGIHWIYNFSYNTGCFYVVAIRRTLNWEKRRVKKNNLAPLALRIQNILVVTVAGILLYPLFCLREWRKFKLSRAGKQAVQSHIVSHVSERLWRSKKRSNVMIQMNSAKIEIYRNKKNGVLQSENQLWREKMVSNPGLSFAPYMK